MTHEQPLAVGTDGAPYGQDGPSPGAVDNGGEQPVSGAVTRLRGADVQVDPRKAAQVALALVLVTLLVLAVVLTVAGVRKNQQIQELRAQGVPIDATVTSCVGLLGGSGSNFVGYSCTGAYTVGTRRYTELLPGTAQQARGAIVHVVVVPSDPGLISTRALVSSERPSWSVLILPATLYLASLLVAALVFVLIRSGRRRRDHAAASAHQ